MRSTSSAGRCPRSVTRASSGSLRFLETHEEPPAARARRAAPRGTSRPGARRGGSGRRGRRRSPPSPTRGGPTPRSSPRCGEPHAPSLREAGGAVDVVVVLVREEDGLDRARLDAGRPSFSARIRGPTPASSRIRVAPASTTAALPDEPEARSLKRRRTPPTSPRNGGRARRRADLRSVPAHVCDDRRGELLEIAVRHPDASLWFPAWKMTSGLLPRHVSTTMGTSYRFPKGGIAPASQSGKSIEASPSGAISSGSSLAADWRAEMLSRHEAGSTAMTW